MTSKYMVDNHQYRNRVGIDICVDYDHVWKSGFGFGINYLHNYTSFDEGVKSRGQLYRSQCGVRLFPYEEFPM